MQRSAMLLKVADSLKESPCNTLKTKFHTEVNILGLQLRSFENTLETIHPSDTPTQHVKRLITNGKTLQAKVDKTTGDMLNMISSNVAILRSEAMKKAGLGQTTAEESREIRAITRAMSHTEHLKLLDKKDPFVISALIDTNPFLSGIDPKVLKGYIDVMLTDSAPEQMRDVGLLAEFSSTVAMIGRETSKSITEAVDSEHVASTLKAAEKDEQIHSDFIAQLGS